MPVLHVKTPNGVTKAYDLDKLTGLPVGFEYFSMNPNIPQSWLPLLGGEYSRSTYADLWAWVQTQTGYCKTEAEWQELSDAQNGNVPFYSSGDGSTTFRVPSLRCWVKGTDGNTHEVGSYKAAGLPNIKGSINKTSGGGAFLNSVIGEISATGSLYISSTSNNLYLSTAGEGEVPRGFGFDASRSSSIYGNTNTVVPESIVGMWLVKAYGTIVDTGTIDEQQYIDDRITTRLPLIGGTMTGAISFEPTGQIGGRTIAHDNNDIDRQLIISATTIDRYDGAGSSGFLALHRYNPDNASREDGGFCLRASNDTTGCDLAGTPTGSLKWNGQSVQTSSDKRIKQDFSDVPDEVLDIWGKVNWQQFKFIADAERKGAENCRWHTGLVAQDVKDVGEENDLDLCKYGILCHDTSGSNDLWMVRYEEALSMEAAYQRRRADRLEERIAKLETLLESK